MIYLSPPTTTVVQKMYKNNRIGAIITPHSFSRRRYVLSEFCCWCADNACFSSNTSFDGELYIDWLREHRHAAESCLFATAPDVVGDAEATWQRSKNWLGLIRTLGYPAAYVAQDGIDEKNIRWDMFDCLFIGGSTEWKLSRHAAKVVALAQLYDKWVHVGRVNSLKRFAQFADMGVDSADGTFVVYGPLVNYAKVEQWVKYQP